MPAGERIASRYHVAQPQLSCVARGQSFGLSLRLLPYFASREDSITIMHMRRLVFVFAVLCV